MARRNKTSKKNNTQNGLILLIGILIVLVGALGGIVLLNWNKIFASSSSSVSSVPQQPASPAPSPSPVPQKPTSPIPQQPTPTPQLTPSVNGSDANLTGQWTSEGDVTSPYLMMIDIEDQDDRVVGTINSINIREQNGVNSGTLSLVEMNDGTMEIYDQNAQPVGKAQLVFQNNTLLWRLIDSQGGAAETLPTTALLTKEE